MNTVNTNDGGAWQRQKQFSQAGALQYNYLCPELSLPGILYLLNFFSLTLFEGDKAMLSYHIRRLPNVY